MMNIVKINIVDEINIVGQFNMVECRLSTWTENDGVMVGIKQFKRYIIAPNDDVTDEPEKIKDSVTLAHTQEIKNAYSVFLAKAGI